MLKNEFKILILVLPLFLGACEKEELPVPRHEAGDVRMATANLGPEYEYQIYFDLRSNTVVSSSSRSIWDLGFETSNEGYRIILNSSKMMFAYKTNSNVFDDVVDTFGFSANKKWGNNSGNLKETAIGDWQSSKNVYIIDRGLSTNGMHQGFKKIRFLDVNAQYYHMRIANLDGSEDTTITLLKDPQYNFVFLSLDGGNPIKVEPPKEEWDIVFTQYTHIFHEPFLLPYLVSGCLLNRYKTAAAMDSLSRFSSMEISDVDAMDFSTDIDKIGYNWKIFDGSQYITNPNKIYLIKDSDNIYYKLHFLDFYGPTGSKGELQFEYQQL